MVEQKSRLAIFKTLLGMAGLLLLLFNPGSEPSQAKVLGSSSLDEPVRLAQMEKKKSKGSFFVSKIEISPRAHSLNPCETKKFVLNVKNKLGKQIKDARVDWESTNPKVAQVDGSGVVVGVNPGFTFIIARNGKVKSNVTSVFVRDKGVRRC